MDRAQREREAYDEGDVWQVSARWQARFPHVFHCADTERHGAAEVFGIDVSESFIARARTGAVPGQLEFAVRGAWLEPQVRHAVLSVGKP